jgi:hypothetical protein
MLGLLELAQGLLELPLELELVAITRQPHAHRCASNRALETTAVSRGALVLSLAVAESRAAPLQNIETLAQGSRCRA